MELSKLDPGALDSRLGPIDAERLAHTPGVDRQHRVSARAGGLQHPARDHDRARHAARRLRARQGRDAERRRRRRADLRRHPRRALGLDLLARQRVLVRRHRAVPGLRQGLDNQRAVTVKSTFLQNRNYLDFYYREAYTVVEMEAGPFCNAVYEIADADRYPSGEAVNFSKLPIDLGIIHYASDTPYSQARTSAPAACPTTAWTPPTRRRWRSCGGSVAGGAVRRLRGLPAEPDYGARAALHVRARHQSVPGVVRGAERGCARSTWATTPDLGARPVRPDAARDPLPA